MRSALLIPALLLTQACTEDPQYVQAPVGIEVGVGDGEDANTGTATLSLPFDLETLMDPEGDVERERLELATALELDAAEVSYVRLDHLSVSVEWTIKNLADADGSARVHLNGGNERFFYNPINFIVVDENGDEEATPPPLAGDIPIDVPALGTVTGVFREDQVREAAIDLELITRGGSSAFAALLSIHEDVTSTADLPPDPNNAMPPTITIPVEAFGQMVQFDLTFEADQHMVLEYVIRVRDHRGLLHDELLAAPAEETMIFMPAEFIPTLAPPP
jgi:hypothetical protein